MSPGGFLGAVVVLIVSVGLATLVLAVLTRQKGLALLGAGVILANANWSSVNGITGDAGVGAGVVLIGVVLVLLTVCFGLPLFRTPRSLVRGSGVLICLSACYVVVLSPAMSINPICSMRTSLSFALVCLVGWCTFGKIFSKRPDLVRIRVLGLIYIVGINNLIILVAASILMGPSSWRLAIGGLESRIRFGSFVVSRLQAEGFNATGLGMLAAGALFVIVHWYQKSGRNVLRRILLGAMIGGTGVLLLWTGGRSAIFAFVGTSLCVVILVSIRNRKRAFCCIITTMMGLVCIYVLRDMFAGIFWRGLTGVGPSKSLIDLFLESRIDASVSALKYYSGNILFGNGTGVLSRGDINAESFFFRVLIEFGVVGGAVYTLTFLSLTHYVLKVDLYHLRLGEPGAWLPSSVFLFAWIISPASYGFSLFTGVLALQIAVAAGAVVEWNKITRAKSCEYK